MMLSSCLSEDFDPESWAIDPELSFSNSVVVFNSTLSSDSIAVYTNYSEFKVESSQDWCSVSVDYNRNSLSIEVSPNFNVEQRSAVITVSVERGNKFLSKDISVVQMGGIWESIGNFNLYWGYEIGQSQKDIIVNLLNSMVYIPSAAFIMGQTDETIVDLAKPHEVKLSPYYISSFEITQSQWNALMGSNPSPYQGQDLPVYNISWTDALEFVTRLSKLTNLDVRIPTEAQWEYAALGAYNSQGYIYSGGNDLNDVAVVYSAEDGGYPSKVGSKRCNEVGLYDMSGNVAEFCSDWFESYYIGDNSQDPTGPDTGIQKSVRGGSFADYSYNCRVTNRFSFVSINDAKNYIGLRIVIVNN
jgi:formylglycine-generating enzyme required for sulfatase activity